jgi:hypothetical protein
MISGNGRMQIVVSSELHIFLMERSDLLHLSMNSIIASLVRKEMERVSIAEQKARMERRTQTQ